MRRSNIFTKTEITDEPMNRQHSGKRAKGDDGRILKNQHLAQEFTRKLGFIDNAAADRSSRIRSGPHGSILPGRADATSPRSRMM